MKTQEKLVLFSVLGLALSMAVVTPSLAATKEVKGFAGAKGHRPTTMTARGNKAQFGHGIMGTVSAISGANLTVAARQGFNTSTAAITYNIDASNATVIKANATSTVSSIIVGDIINIQGTISGTNVVATSIRDGFGKNGQGGFGRPGENHPSTTPIQGDGQPVVMGNISAISGSTLTVNTGNGVQYTVDASNAKITKARSTSSVASLSVGDNVVVQGATSGTAITASSVMDQARPVINNTATTATKTNANRPNIFSRIGGFFKHLFGF